MPLMPFIHLFAKVGQETCLKGWGKGKQPQAEPSYISVPQMQKDLWALQCSNLNFRCLTSVTEAKTEIVHEFSIGCLGRRVR